jgi:hypothetical protein
LLKMFLYGTTVPQGIFWSNFRIISTWQMKLNRTTNSLKVCADWSIWFPSTPNLNKRHCKLQTNISH